MNDHRWGDATWTELARLGLATGGRWTEASERPPVVALLPVGAVEAHGPHLPLVTDVLIATAGCDAASAELRATGYEALVLPPLYYTAAEFAAGFPGTVSLRPATVAAVLTDLAESLDRQGVAALVVANAHLDPGHVGAIRAGIDGYEGTMPVVFPDITKRPWAQRLTDEFKSGACHGGQYETSVVLAVAPDLVREGIRKGLAENPASLSRAIGAGLKTFEEAGLGEAYCGAPAAATREEGLETVAVLGTILVEALQAELDSGAEEP